MSEPEKSLDTLITEAANRVRGALNASGITDSQVLESFTRDGVTALAESVRNLQNFDSFKDDLVFLWRHSLSSVDVSTNHRTGELHVLLRYMRQLSQALPRNLPLDWQSLEEWVTAIGILRAVVVFHRGRTPSTAKEALVMLLARSNDGDSVPVEELERILGRL